MVTTTFSDEALALCLALDACDQWKQENGYKTLSADDLESVKEWLVTSRAKISKFQGLQALATRGIDELIPLCHQASLYGGNLTANLRQLRGQLMAA